MRIYFFTLYFQNMSLGLLFLGRGSSDTGGLAVSELLAYAHETKHEKIIRGGKMREGYYVTFSYPSITWTYACLFIGAL